MHTGDLATLDEEGYCHIVGRSKDMIIRGGENIYPREIEEFLYRHPKIETPPCSASRTRSTAKRYAPGSCAKPGESLTAEELCAVLPLPDRALQGAGAHASGRANADDRNRQNAEVPDAPGDGEAAGNPGASCLFGQMRFDFGPRPGHGLATRRPTHERSGELDGAVIVASAAQRRAQPSGRQSCQPMHLTRGVSLIGESAVNGQLRE